MSESADSTAGRPSLAVADLDAAEPNAATELLRPCCASSRWLEQVVGARPYATLEVLSASSDQVLAGLGRPDILQALAAHPRIGESASGADTEAAWSRAEQSGAAEAGADTALALRDGNVAYEEKFGFVFLICATDLSSEQMLTDLHARLSNDEASEWEVVQGELRKIVKVRLAKLFRPDDETIEL